MAEVLRPELQFRTSSRCTGGACVEVAFLPDGGTAVRDGTDHTRKPLMCSHKQWCHFVSRVKNGHFDI
jgi:Domain of unknown function (DUF397)